MQQICKTNKLFVQCHVKGTLTTQLINNSNNGSQNLRGEMLFIVWKIAPCGLKLIFVVYISFFFLEKCEGNYVPKSNQNL